ncbi:hypothetical protein PVAND_000372 [Polypedilum vanderplanki]|uniref:RING-type domain-containing protein n=1 Tax=Polypedilum vanderplanki TaxID=319348 RepID=A0A9J6BK48_POLVA|nr:hypothetical protein PVAND_000372 [Polypedilum vanderplanki]
MIECGICNNNLQEIGAVAINCGHIYCKNCISSWKQKGQNGCPQCRKPMIQTIDLYLPPDNEPKHIETIMKNVILIKSMIEAKEKEQKNAMDLLLETVQNLRESISDLKKDNAELKTKVNELEFTGSPGNSTEQMRNRNILIENLRKENQDLKIQRAELSKQLDEINQQVKNLKANRAPLKSVNGNEQPKSLTLSLKFDDISDQLIVNDC